MSGKHETIENIRNRGLEKNPDGYILSEPDKYHSCRICGEVIQNSKAWWDKWGMKCLDCKRNVDEEVIPPEVAKDKDMWLQDWDFKSSYDVHPATRGKLVRQGILKVRVLKREDGGTYFNVYLIDDNKEFFKKYLENTLESYLEASKYKPFAIEMDIVLDPKTDSPACYHPKGICPKDGLYPTEQNISFILRLIQ